MNTWPPALLAALAAVTVSISAASQSGATAPWTGPGPRQMDCAAAKDKARCAALNKRIAACRDKIDDAWRRCMGEPAPNAKFVPPKPRDCTKARNRERCEAHSAALAACKDMGSRAEHRKCMAAALQAPPQKKG